jgi:CRISPR-associated protein (TIGR03984 family)
MSDAVDTSPTTKEFANDNDLYRWIEEQAEYHQLPYLLGHAEDGIIWGRFDKLDNWKLTTAEKVFTRSEFEKFKIDFPKLRLLTLQQCRIFGQNGEVLIWQISDKKFRWRFLGNPKEEKILENQILWGTNGIKQNNFTLLWDGSQGLKHAVPFTDVELKGDRLVNPVRLVVHHYIQYDESGVARIYLSQLVDLRGT